jgi:hypothetical protein
MRVIKVICFVFLFSFLVKGQNYKEEVLSIGRSFSVLKNYALTMNYKLYFDNDLSKPYEEANVDVKRHNNSIYVKQSIGSELMENDLYQFIVDDNMKMLSVVKKEENKDVQLEGLYETLVNGIDSASLMYEKIKLLEKNGDRVKYELLFKPNDIFNKVVMEINKKTHMYESLTIYYKNPVPISQLNGKMHLVTLKITYSNYKPNGVSDTKIFSSSNYIVVSKSGKVTPIKKYSGYQFLNPQ